MPNVALRTFTAVAIFALSVPAVAALQRTFVASTGSDSNPCSLPLPCRGFAIAVAAVAPAGEVIVLDSGGYGPVVITQSVSIIAPAGVVCGSERRQRRRHRRKRGAVGQGGAARAQRQWPRRWFRYPGVIWERDRYRGLPHRKSHVCGNPDRRWHGDAYRTHEGPRRRRLWYLGIAFVSDRHRAYDHRYRGIR